MLQTPNLLESPVYPNLPECENGSVGSISKDELNAAWLAGILDGEGCIVVTYANGNVSRNHYRTRIEVRNTNPFMIQRITDILSSWELKFFLNFIKRQGNYKQSIAVVVTGYKTIFSLLQRVLPHLTAKQEEAKLMYDFINWRLNEHPMQGCNGGERMEILREKYVALYHILRKIKRRTFGLQRLPRRTSGTLSLTKLKVHEVMV